MSTGGSKTLRASRAVSKPAAIALIALALLPVSTPIAALAQNAGIKTPAAADAAPPSQAAPPTSATPATTQPAATQPAQSPTAPSPAAAGATTSNTPSANQSSANEPSANESSAAPVPTPPATELAAMPDAMLPHDLTPIGMFLAADYIVKAVMIGLAFASVVTWSVWLAKVIELMGARRKLLRDLRKVEQSGSLGEACARLPKSNGDIAILARAAADELKRSHDAMNHEGVKERIASLFNRIEAAAARRMTRGTGILATIGSTGPFVGLFGTVWGIMNSFIGISKAHTTNLAVVAPGIAEALLATALGLVAAIPAVMIFNMFARAITGYRGLLGDGSAELMRMVSRDLDRADFFLHRRAAE
ncbi:MAG: tonB-system energizer ExbB [Xanthobacteraceae bacterium]|nr:tonB-system energizer ExbB [Xanthobacteraceae bacterium]